MFKCDWPRWALLLVNDLAERGQRLFLIPGVDEGAVVAEDEAGIAMPLPFGDQADFNFLLNQVDDERAAQRADVDARNPQILTGGFQRLAGLRQLNTGCPGFRRGWISSRMNCSAQG